MSYILHIAERGYLGERFTDRGNGKHATIGSIDFTSSDLKDIIDVLCKTANADKATAMKYLFSDIPDLTGNTYIEHEISQSKFKTGICYFANVKTMACFEFYQEFGAKLDVYKEFTCFMRVTAANEVTAVFGESNPHAMALQKIASNKVKKLFSDKKSESKEPIESGSGSDDEKEVKSIKTKLPSMTVGSSSDPIPKENKYVTTQDLATIEKEMKSSMAYEAAQKDSSDLAYKKLTF